MFTNVPGQSTNETGLLIHIKRSSENNVHTYGSFVLKDLNTEQTLSGYSVEPGGLTGPLHLSGKRLPAGSYRVSWHFIAGEGSRLVLYNALVKEHQQVLLGNAGTLTSDQSYLTLLSSPCYQTGVGGGGLGDARSVQSKIEALVRNAGVAQVQVQIDDF